MMKILGIPLPTFISRVATALIYGFISILIWLIIPSTILPKTIEGGIGGLSTSTFIYYAILIAFLSGVQSIFNDKFVGDAAAVANGIAQIYYLYLITNGGILTYVAQQQGIALTLDFRTILYLLMIPSAISAVRAIVHASSRVSTKSFEDAEEILLH